MSSPGATTNILSSAEQSLSTISASQTLPLSPSTILASSTEATTPSAVIQSTASALTGQILFSGETAGITTIPVQSTITTATARVSPTRLTVQLSSSTAPAKVTAAPTTTQKIQTTALAKVSPSQKVPSTTTTRIVSVFLNSPTTAVARALTSIERLQTGQVSPMYTKTVTERLSSFTANAVGLATQLPTTTSASHKSSLLPTTTIVAIVVSVLAGLIVITIFVVLFWCWRNKQSSYEIHKSDALELSSEDQMAGEFYADQNTNISLN
jgi:hypothetical protein